MTQYLDIEGAFQLVEGYGFHGLDIGLLASAPARPGTAVLRPDAYPVHVQGVAAGSI